MNPHVCSAYRLINFLVIGAVLVWRPFIRKFLLIFVDYIILRGRWMAYKMIFGDRHVNKFIRIKGIKRRKIKNLT